MCSPRPAPPRTAGDAAGARDAYAAALAAWRGPPLVDIGDLHWVDAEARRLDELRLSALAERIELDLAAGRHDALVAELEALVAEHPLRERFSASPPRWRSPVTRPRAWRCR